MWIVWAFAVLVTLLFSSSYWDSYDAEKYALCMVVGILIQDGMKN